MAEALKFHIFMEDTFTSNFEEEAHIYVKHYIPKEGISDKKKIYPFYFSTWND